LVIETSLYYGARSRKHQIMVKSDLEVSRGKRFRSNLGHYRVIALVGMRKTTGNLSAQQVS